ncbi:bestrophin family protein [Methylovorus menthalis]|uniref:bestrophin family protein n=1 Tax=Methylovorus menthalis TaxID=1002227 RepID=UPI001E63E5F3|nr:bestrophin family protein [Methylovorus menthalis]MCB4811204.1 bestrophin family protein [Methylovorus menthalis]
MIIRNRPSLIHLFFIVRGSIVMRILPRILVITAMSALIVLTHRLRPDWLPTFESAPFALLGIALSVFLAFRNNACYDRWWEARKQWGELVTTTRTLARQSMIINATSVEARDRLLQMAIGFTHALRQQLRASEDLETQLTTRSQAGSPESFLEGMQREIITLRSQGILTDIPYSLLDQSIAHLSRIQSACERLLTTPVPFGYTLLLHRTAYTFCFLLPFGFADSLGWVTPFASALVAYTFFGLDALGDELEAPFSTQPNALPIDALSRQIEINLLQAMGVEDLPPLKKPVNFILL